MGELKFETFFIIMHDFVFYLNVLRVFESLKDV
jgi:hypothetical protein